MLNLGTRVLDVPRPPGLLMPTWHAIGGGGSEFMRHHRHLGTCASGERGPCQLLASIRGALCDEEEEDEREKKRLSGPMRAPT